MIAILQDSDLINSVTHILQIKELSIGGILIVFIGLLIYQIKYQQKKHELKEAAYLEVIEKKDIEIRTANEGRMQDLRGFTDQLISIQRSTDQLIGDLKNLYKKN